jgi:GNAT superfamily N-acetyltransferase
MTTRVLTYYLEMTEPSRLRPAPGNGDLEVRRAEVVCPELNRFFYTAVGGDWFWIDRLPWTYEHWLRWLDRPEVTTWIGSHRGSPAGYFELEHEPDTGVEIAYFGLLPQFLGRGLGSQLLTAAVRRGWELGPKRVWLHTCTLDHPQALANYQARGFTLYKQEESWVTVPERTPGPWPGADRLSG